MTGYQQLDGRIGFIFTVSGLSGTVTMWWMDVVLAKLDEVSANTQGRKASDVTEASKGCVSESHYLFCRC